VGLWVHRRTRYGERHDSRVVLSGSRALRRALILIILAGVMLVAGAAFAARPPGGTFTDDNGNVHEPNIEAIAAEGITFGCNPPENTKYCPGDAVTRGQMAAFLDRAFGSLIRLSISSPITTHRYSNRTSATLPMRG
jgi:hypothetical protein